MSDATVPTPSSITRVLAGLAHPLWRNAERIAEDFDGGGRRESLGRTRGEESKAKRPTPSKEGWERRFCNVG